MTTLALQTALMTASDLRGYALGATDGEIGKVEELYFDDETWAIRYLVVRTDGWLGRHKVLISPLSIREVHRELREIAVALSREEVRRSPDIDTHKPVSRRHEAAYFSHYGYPYYWRGPLLWGPVAYPSAMPAAGVSKTPEAEQESEDVHLRSTSEVAGYRIEASDGDIGHVDDFVVEDQSWAIRYVVVDTHNWLPGKKVLVSPEWIRSVSWEKSRVYVDLTKDAVRTSPEYDAARLTRDYESRLHGHYDRRGYWI